MKRFSLSGKGPVPGSTLLLVLIAMYSFAPAHHPPALSHSNTGQHTTASENRTDALRSSYGGSSYGGSSSGGHAASAQEDEPEETITGTVYDAAGPVMDVAVSVKGTAKVAYTDENGHYLIEASIGDVLVFSYPGYETLEITVGNQTLIDVELNESVTQLKEAVINAGYYTVKDKEKTGSISRVTADEIGNQAVGNVLSAMQGRMAGVQIVQNSGGPGGGYEVLIRGKNSIASGNSPLYIIDGVPYDMQSMGVLGISGTIIPNANINPLNFLDPSSVESVEVLKDADATAIYGSRGANGVILISTKMGKSGKPIVKLNFTTGFYQATEMMKLLNTEQYINIREEAFANDGLESLPSNAYDINGTWDKSRFTDWQQEFIGNQAYFNSAILSIAGGSDRTRYLLGGNFSKETTVFPGNYNYKKSSFYTTIHHGTKNERLSFHFSGYYGKDNNFLPPIDLTYIARTLPPNAPELYDANNELNWENGTWSNPIAPLQGNYRNYTKSLIGNAGIDYKLWNHTILRGSFGYNESEMTEIKLTPHTIYNPAYGFTSDWSRQQNNQSQRSSWIIEPQIDGNYQLWGGELSVTLGATFQQMSGNSLSILGEGFSNNSFINNLSAAKRIFIENEISSEYKYIAFYGRLNYNISHKYIVNLTGRRDGSSRFGPHNRFANFGAVGAAWLFSKESFLENYRDILSFGKLRLSYGTSGNDQIGDHQYLNTYTYQDANYDGYLQLDPTRLFNPNFAWERNRKLDLALELGFFKEKILLETGYYNSRSSNQLIGNPLPGTTGFTGIQANLDATVENSGWEFQLKSENFRTATFKWITAFNLSIPRNKLIEFNGLEESVYANRFVTGESINVQKLYKLKGVNPQTGLYEFEDYNGDGIITSAEDREYLVDLGPKYYGGMTNTIQYKNWSLDLLFQFVKKMGYNEFYGMYNPPGTMYNLPVTILNHWKAPGDDSRFQRMTAGYDGQAYLAHNRFSASNGIISDASFIRLKSLELAYQLPPKQNENLSCRIYITGYNLWTLTKFKGGDPEQLNNYLPPMRRLAIGFEITF